ncbi:MAG: hypothetical protein LAT81_10550, partial [Oceanicaulis sp.]|nr:hypothetical protein [Oceanicaulis sp.]
DNTTVKSFAGLNELNLVPLAGTPADVVSAIVTPSLDGVLRVTNQGGSQRAAGAMINIGSGGVPETLILRQFYPRLGVYVFGFCKYGGPFETLVCETNPESGECLAEPTEELETELGEEARTFAVIVRANRGFGARLFPNMSRVGLQYFDARNNLVGETNIAYTAPAPAPVHPNDPAALTGYAGIYNVNTISDDGQMWNGSQDIGTGYAVIDTEGGIWLVTFRESARLSTDFVQANYFHQFIGYGQITLGAVDGDTQALSAQISGVTRLTGANPSSEIAAEAVLSGRGAPNGYFFGNLTRTANDSSHPAIANWPSNTNLRANIDAHTIDPVSVSALAGEYSDQRVIANPDAAAENFLEISAEGELSGFFQFGSGDDAESCTLNGLMVQPDPERHVLMISGTVAGNNSPCSLAGPVAGVAAYNQPRVSVLQSGRVESRQLQMLLRNTTSGAFLMPAFYRGISE